MRRYECTYLPSQMIKENSDKAELAMISLHVCVIFKKILEKQNYVKNTTVPKIFVRIFKNVKLPYMKIS